MWCGLCVLLCVFALQLWHSPYYNKREDRLESLTLGATVVSLLLGMALLLGQDGGASDGLVSGLRAVVGTLNVGVVVVFAWQLVAELRAVRRAAKAAGASAPVATAPAAPASTAPAAAAPMPAAAGPARSPRPAAALANSAVAAPASTPPPARRAWFGGAGSTLAAALRQVFRGSGEQGNGGRAAAHSWAVGRVRGTSFGMTNPMHAENGVGCAMHAEEGSGRVELSVADEELMARGSAGIRTSDL